jgi:hypothetical protein
VTALPIVLEVFETIEHREQAEVHRAHVQRRHFGLEACRRLHALLRQHVGAAAGGQVDDGARARVHCRQEARERLGRLVGPAGGEVARVQVQDRRARFGGRHRFVGDLLRRDRQVRRHRGRVDRPRDRAGDDDLAL